ncbi:MAG: BatA domain-containing protein [Planctomycetota bacterium]|jgi:hypothetical protein
MTFLHPWAIWVGAAAAAGPVVVHFLTRPRPVRMPLSTLRFVREAVRQRRARHRLRDLVILLLRTSAILLLALAVARPQWGERPLVSDRDEADTVRVVVIDLSQSMAATQGGIEAIERARTAAAGFLRYRRGLRANLILSGARPRAVFDRPSANFDALCDELAQCKVLPQSIDVNRALGTAARMLARENENDRRRRELVVVSDFQRANWAKADFSQLPDGTQIQLESTASASSPANLAIVRVEGRGRSSSGQSLQLEVDVGNFSPVARNTTVEVAVGESTWRWSAPCPAGRITTLSQEIQLRGLGWQSGRARLADVDDALAADNARPFVARVRAKPVYALVTRQPAAQRPSSSHYMECALVPDARKNAEASAAVLRIDPADFQAAAVRSADLIVLDHPGKLSGEAVKLLADLMRRGRPILYVAGETVDATNLKLLADAAGSGLQMPVEFVPALAGRLRRDLFLTSVADDRPPFDAFGEQVAAVVGPLRFAGGLGSRRVEGGLNDDLLATYSDGSACMVVTESDAGALAVLNADLAASNLPGTTAFVPLVEELAARLLDRNRADSTHRCGEPLVAHLPASVGPAAGLEIVGSDGAGPEPSGGPFGELAEGEAGVAWHWLSPTQPGVYQVCREETPLFSLAVAVPAEESQLEGLSPDVLRSRLAAGHDLYYHSTTGEGDRRDDAWKWLAVACVFCGLGELAALLAFRT